MRARIAPWRAALRGISLAAPLFVFTQTVGSLDLHGARRSRAGARGRWVIVGQKRAA